MGGSIPPMSALLAPIWMSICLGAIVGRIAWYADWHVNRLIKGILHILVGGFIVALAWCLFLFFMGSGNNASGQLDSSAGPSWIEVFFYFFWPTCVIYYAIFGLLECVVSRNVGRAAV